MNGDKVVKEYRHVHVTRFHFGPRALRIAPNLVIYQYMSGPRALVLVPVPQRIYSRLLAFRQHEKAGSVPTTATLGVKLNRLATTVYYCKHYSRNLTAAADSASLSLSFARTDLAALLRRHRSS